MVLMSWGYCSTVGAEAKSDNRAIFGVPCSCLAINKPVLIAITVIDPKIDNSQCAELWLFLTILLNIISVARIFNEKYEGLIGNGFFNQNVEIKMAVCPIKS